MRLTFIDPNRTCSKDGNGDDDKTGARGKDCLQRGHMSRPEEATGTIARDRIISTPLILPSSMAGVPTPIFRPPKGIPTYKINIAVRKTLTKLNFSPERRLSPWRICQWPDRLL